MKILHIAFATLSLLAVVGCSMGRVNERQEYWTATTAARLPVGTSHADADALFAANGLALKCCVSGPELTKAYFATEKNVGRELVTEYDVVILVDFSKADRVERVRVQRWGVGL